MPTLAFPGAVGFGRFAVGGRGGRIILVTNLNDSGAGSFRAACEASGARIIIFRVAGTIFLLSPIVIRNPFITILAQTAPGDGICIKNGFLKVQTHDVIIRGLRIRPGDGTPNSDAQKGLELTGVDNIIIDHCSISWSRDQLINAWNSYDRVTIQDSILAEPFEVNPPGGLGGKDAIGRGIAIGAGDDPNAIHGGFTVCRTIIAHSLGRNPRPRNGSMEFVNNTVYNWKGMGGQTDGECQFDVIGNTYKRGPESVAPAISTRNETAALRIYMEDNQFDIAPQVAAQYISETRLNSSGLIPMARAEAYDAVMEGSGAWPRDDVDQRILNDVENGTGELIDSQNEVGGWPVLVGVAAPDNDGDGVPNVDEIRHGWDPNTADAEIFEGEYMRVEVYGNEIFDPEPPPPPTGVFSVTPSITGYGGGFVTLAWTSENATSATIGTQEVPVAGSMAVEVHETTVWELTLHGPGGSTVYTGMATVPIDEAPPTCVILAPKANATVRGVVALSASASDNWGIQKVEFFVDGKKVGEATNAPYFVMWHSDTVKNGWHTVSATATDLAGNTAKTPSVRVRVVNFQIVS